MPSGLPAARRLISLGRMRNPIRLKNLRLRFLPWYLIGVAVLAFHPPATGDLLRALPWLVAGAGLRAWGAGHLVKTDALTTTGPYAHLRHPLYLGTLLIGSGFAIALGGRLGLAVLVLLWLWFAAVYFPRKERSESARLAERYGERFLRYRREVPALRPRLSPWRGSGSDPSDPGARTGAAAVAGEGHTGGRWDFSRYADNNELGALLAVLGGWLVLWWRAGVGA